MHQTLPVYCETALNALGSFPAEPVNALTSFVPVVFGVLALVYLIRNGQASRVAYTLAVLTIMTGLGSVAWHAMRTPLTLFVDWFPGFIYFLVLMYAWVTRAGSRWMAWLLLAAFLALLVLVPQPVRYQYHLVIAAVILVIAGGLLYSTWQKDRQAFRLAALMVGSALVALALRTLDLRVCEVMPVGTHFFWHIFLGLAAYLGVRLAAVLAATRRVPRTRASAPAADPGTP